MYILERVEANLDGRKSLPLEVSINPEALWKSAREYNEGRDWESVYVGEDGCGHKTAKEDDYGGVYYVVGYIKEV